VAILLDYSAGQLSGAAVANAGAAGVIRYGGTPGRIKNTTPGEVASQHAAGREVHMVYENGTSDFLGGYNAGRINAAALAADASHCGVTGYLFMSADQHLSSSQIGVWQAYVDGAQTVLGERGGAYGFSEALLAVRGATHVFWQSGAHPSATGTSGFVNVWQRNSGQTTLTVSGITCDISDVLIPLGDEVALDANDANTIWSAPVWFHYPAGPLATWLTSVGYTANADGSVDVRNVGAGELLNVAATRIGLIESQVAQLLARPAGQTVTIDPTTLVQPIVDALIPHLPAAADTNAIATAVKNTIQAQFNK
jgi:hypothetical protein